MTFGETIKNLLYDTNHTQQELADYIGYSQRAVSKWINNQSDPTGSAIIACAKFFSVSSDYLLGLDDKNLIERPPYEITDKPLIDLMKLFKIMTELQKAQVLGFAIGLLEQSGINVKNVLGY